MKATRGIDLTGHRYGRWVVVGPRVIRAKNTYWTCRCDCGNTRIVHAGNLRSGGSTSCGCYNSELMTARNTRHNGSRRGRKTVEYVAWEHLRKRCLNPSDKSYEGYGGRGITVCERWNDFAAFLADMGPRPSPKHSIDRIDVDGPYAPENCRWATAQEQANNKRNNRRLTLNGVTRTMSEWSRITGIGVATILNRIDRRGWSAEYALTATVGMERRQPVPRRRTALPPGVKKAGPYVRRGG